MVNKYDVVVGERNKLRGFVDKQQQLLYKDDNNNYVSDSVSDDSDD